MFFKTDRLVKWIFSIIAGFLFVACSSGPQVAEGAGTFDGSGSRAVYIANHGWHTGIVLPAPAIQARSPELKERFGKVAYLEFGWGDKDFYQADEMTSGLTLRALFWPTDSVVRALALRRHLPDYFAKAGVVKLCLNDTQLSSLADFVAESFAKTDGATIEPLAAAASRNSQFYAGAGQYHLTNTCNTWTAKGLASAGMDMSTGLRLTAGSVMSYLHQHPRARTIRHLDQATGVQTDDFSCP